MTEEALSIVLRDLGLISLLTRLDAPTPTTLPSVSLSVQNRLFGEQKEEKENGQSVTPTRGRPRPNSVESLSREGRDCLYVRQSILSVGAKQRGTGARFVPSTLAMARALARVSRPSPLLHRLKGGLPNLGFRSLQ